MVTHFLHLNRALMLWTKHPFERDASILKSALRGKDPKKIIMEVVCTRTRAHFVGAKMAYSAMYKTTLEEDIEAYTPRTLEYKLLGALLLGRLPKLVNHDDVPEDVKRDAKILFNTLRGQSPDEEKVVEMLVCNYASYLNSVYNSYKDENNASIEEDLKNHEVLKVVMESQRKGALELSSSYFTDLLGSAFATKDADTLTRIIVTNEDEAMKFIKRGFHKKNGISLSQMVKDVVHEENFRDFLLSLIAKVP